VNLEHFRKLLAKHLLPVLRAEGFRGSGATLRRVAAPLVHVFNVQGSSGGERCYLILGAHLSFLSAQPLVPDKLLEYECAFRARLNPPEEAALGWSYGGSATAAEAMALAAVDVWRSQGRAFFAAYAVYPASFATLVEGFSPHTAHPAASLTMAKVAKQLGERERAKAIAMSAIQQVSSSAAALRRSLEEF